MFVRAALVFATTTALIAMATVPVVAEGQATAAPDTRLAGLDRGKHLYGIEFDSEQHLGEVVVVNIGGA